MHRHAGLRPPSSPAAALLQLLHPIQPPVAGHSARVASSTRQQDGRPQHHLPLRRRLLLHLLLSFMGHRHFRRGTLPPPPPSTPIFPLHPLHPPPLPPPPCLSPTAFRQRTIPYRHGQLLRRGLNTCPQSCTKTTPESGLLSARHTATAASNCPSQACPAAPLSSLCISVAIGNTKQALTKPLPTACER